MSGLDLKFYSSCSSSERKRDEFSCSVMDHENKYARGRDESGTLRAGEQRCEGL